MLVFAAAMAPHPAAAQNGWWYSWAGTGGSANEACHVMWERLGMNNGKSRFIGAVESREDHWGVKDCSWTSYQWLCQEETGGGVFGCGTSLPGAVGYACPDGYIPTFPGRCVPASNNRPERPPELPRSCDPSLPNTYPPLPNPTIGNPIIINTGSKVLSTTDFVTADSRFRIGRNYRSQPVGRTLSALRLPLGLAPGWQFDFEMEIHLGKFKNSPAYPTGNVTLITPDGSGYDFTLQSNGTWIPNSALGAVSNEYKLEFIGTLPAALDDIDTVSTQWKVTGPDDRVWTLKTFADPNRTPADYDIARPIQIRERDGYTYTLTYDAKDALSTLQDNFGRTASFVWTDFYPTALPNATNALPYPEAVKQITFPDGTKVQYTYDPAPATSAPSTTMIARLTKAEWKNAANVTKDSATYHYEAAGFSFALTGVTDHRNIRVATYAYDSMGRAISTEGANGANKFTVAYSAAGGQEIRDVTNALGRTTKYKFDHIGSSAFDIRLAGVDGLVTTNCPASTRSYSYGTNGYVSSQTDNEGRITNFVRDTLGRPTTITQAAGTPSQRQTTITWHSTLNVPTLIAEPGLSRSFVWDTAGRLTSRTETDTTAHTLPYSTNGQTRTWTYAYNAAGFVSSVDGPLAGTGDTIFYTYDAAGYLATYKDEVGILTTVQAVNGRGQPTQIQDPNGLVTQLVYDTLGQLTTVTQNPGGIAAQTLITYDDTGNVTKITEPNGAFLAYTYDNASRITKIADNFSDSVNYTYDALGNITSIETKEDPSTVYFSRTQTFDELGRLLKIIDTDSATWTFGYDKVGNPTSMKDPNNNTSSSVFDGLNRLITFTDERLATTAATYDPSGEPATLTDPRNVVTSYVRNGWGEVIREQSNDIGAVVYVRDTRGLVTQRTDARAKVTQYTYDNASRLKTVVYPTETASNRTYAYDSIAGGNVGKGRLTSVSDAAGTVAYVYDILGRVKRENRVIATRSYDIFYEWDKSGRPTKITYPSGRVVEIGRDASGASSTVATRLNSAALPVDLVTWVGRVPFGPRYAIHFANDTRDARRYDETNRISNLELLVDSTSINLIDKNYHYNDKRNLTAINDFMNAAQNETYTYTANGFLASGQGPWGTLTYSTDGVGNITQRVRTVGAITTTDIYGIASGSNRLSNVTTNGTVSRTFTSDASGNITADTTVTPAQAKNYTYNSEGKLSTALLGTTSRGAYVYDYLSRLVSRTNQTVPVTLHYVHDLDGNVIAEYTSAGVLQREYIWLDERPLAVVADAGTATPKIYWVGTDHLERPVMMTDANAAVAWQAKYLPYGEVYSITGPASLDQRFPGQWFQMETGLHYNWHRHYDASTGRYMQPDPIGMPDGPSRWAYVANSPLMKVDQQGLSAGGIGRVAPTRMLMQSCSSYGKTPDGTPAEPTGWKKCLTQLCIILGLNNPLQPPPPTIEDIPEIRIIIPEDRKKKK